MANTMQLDLGDRHYDMSAPTAVQLGTLSLLTSAHFTPGPFRSIVPPRGIVDVGACIGKVSLVLSHIWRDAKILSLEPHPMSFEYLKRNCASVPNIECLQMAASDKEETFRIAIPDEGQTPSARSKAENVGMASRFGTSDLYAAEVNAKKLDDIVDFKVDFLKIDVEGMEVSVLKGAKRILTEDRPSVMIEVRACNLAMAGNVPDDIYQLLAKFGYDQIGLFLSDPWFTYKGVFPSAIHS